MRLGPVQYQLTGVVQVGGRVRCRVLLESTFRFGNGQYYPTEPRCDIASIQSQAQRAPDQAVSPERSRLSPAVIRIAQAASSPHDGSVTLIPHNDCRCQLVIRLQRLLIIESLTCTPTIRHCIGRQVNGRTLEDNSQLLKFEVLLPLLTAQ